MQRKFWWNYNYCPIFVYQNQIFLNVSWHCSTENNWAWQEPAWPEVYVKAVCTLLQETMVVAPWRPLGWSGIQWDTICFTVPHKCLCGTSLWRGEGQVAWGWQLVLLSEVIIDCTAWAVFQLFGLLKSYRKALKFVCSAKFRRANTFV